jgi:hypothetical protein
VPCPKCDHTLQNLGLTDADRRTFWCPRCGTLKTEIAHMGREYEQVETPKLVACVRSFVGMIAATDAGRWLKEQAEVSGVLESACKPSERT